MFTEPQILDYDLKWLLNQTQIKLHISYSIHTNHSTPKNIISSIIHSNKEFDQSKASLIYQTQWTCFKMMKKGRKWGNLGSKMQAFPNTYNYTKSSTPPKPQKPTQNTSKPWKRTLLWSFEKWPWKKTKLEDERGKRRVSYLWNQFKFKKEAQQQGLTLSNCGLSWKRNEWNKSFLCCGSVWGQ